MLFEEGLALEKRLNRALNLAGKRRFKVITGLYIKGYKTAYELQHFYFKLNRKPFERMTFMDRLDNKNFYKYQAQGSLNLYFEYVAKLFNDMEKEGLIK
jgi:hypothetical protein|tara:strand:- start:2583 stop:2879 length:297 start_codon:yes stop_codon:yes gene_type:complete